MIAKTLTTGHRLGMTLALAGAGLALAVTPVRADPWGASDSAAGVTVHAPHHYARQPVTGAQVRLDEVSYVVSLRDLDLSTRHGARLAKARIERAARAVCEAAQDRYPNDEDIDGGCYPTAVRDALIQTERLARYPIVAWGYR